MLVFSSILPNLLNSTVVKWTGGLMERFHWLINRSTHMLLSHSRRLASFANPQLSWGLHVEDAHLCIYVHQKFFYSILMWGSVQKLRAVHVRYLAVTCISKLYCLSLSLTWPLTHSSSLPCHNVANITDLQYIVLHKRAEPQTTGSSSQLVSTMDTYCI